MSDLISRQDAVEALIKADRNCGIDSAEVIKQLPSAQQWIPYDERTPEQIGDYLVTIRQFYDNSTYYDDVDVATFGGNDTWTTFNDWDEGFDIVIIGWMPLPTPYRRIKHE